MDEGLEHAMYRLLREALPESILVSVGHRSSLREFHTQELTLLGEGAWRLSKLVALSAYNAPKESFDLSANYDDHVSAYVKSPASILDGRHL